MTRSDAIQCYLDAGLLRQVRDPFDAYDGGTVLVCELCGQVDGHAKDCRLAERLARIQTGEARA